MNQYNSRKGTLIAMLDLARENLNVGHVSMARYWLAQWRNNYDAAPASTRRRWKCGR